MRTLFISAICLSLLPALAAARQAATGSLPATSRPHVQNDKFGIVTSVRGLPLGIRNELQTLFATPSLDIAEPGTPYRGANASGDPSLPLRRLVSAGCSVDHCLVYYERGGSSHTWHVMLFHWTPDATRLEWGSVAPGGLATIEKVREAVLAGTIAGPADSW